MKTYLQSLPEPLLTANIGQEVVKIFSSVPNNTTTSQLKELILQIPNENRQLLLALVNLAHLISTQQQFNKMDRVNMGTIFGPYIFWKEYSMKSISEVKCVNALFTYLITNISDFIDVMLD
ncbi:RhoGAP domain containing protein [Entamoeba histolytica KU27]|nr:RhoGAP domain containing protein [Entamoeba histolytica KU27]ENY65438.1 RhoGAP domain containing protein [Entamoeba histolytica HM-1:IMSS-A]